MARCMARGRSMTLVQCFVVFNIVNMVIKCFKYRVISAKLGHFLLNRLEL